MIEGPWRIHLHWTAGSPGIVEVERDAYHFIISREGEWTTGDYSPEDNIPPLGPNYAAHTKNANSWAIGVALDGMHDAKERPFSPGPFPITWEQINSMTCGVADLCQKYNIPIARNRVLSHAEVERTLGIKQDQKWDITWLPGMVGPGDAIVVGDRLRDMIRRKMINIEPPPIIPKPKPLIPPQPKPESWWSRFWKWF